MLLSGSVEENTFDAAAVEALQHEGILKCYQRLTGMSQSRSHQNGVKCKPQDTSIVPGWPPSKLFSFRGIKLLVQPETWDHKSGTDPWVSSDIRVYGRPIRLGTGALAVILPLRNSAVKYLAEELKADAFST